jgi:hypothetical protein
VDVNDDHPLSEQRSYYRARAPEYDEWWQRRGRYDHGEDQPLDQRHLAVMTTWLMPEMAITSPLERLAVTDGT